MKIALAQLNYHIGNFENNTGKIISAIKKAKGGNVDVVVFAELAVCAYPPRDFLEFKDFIDKCQKSIDQIAKECTGIAAIVGGPSVNPRVEGKNLFNSAYFLAEGKIQSVHNKALLPNYDVFDEYRYFEHAKEFHVANYKGKKIAITICEDLWDIEEDLMYTINPMDILIDHKPDFMVNIAASPFSYYHVEKRIKVLAKNSSKYRLPLFYVNHVGAQTEIIFDGGSIVTDAKGEIIDELKYFDEDFKIYDTENLKSEIKNPKSEIFNIPSSAPLDRLAISRIHDALVLGIKDYFQKLGFKKAILGLSGGIDSAIVAVLAARALGEKNVQGILMPSKYSTDHSVKDAEILAKNIGCPYDIIPIKNIVDAYDKNLVEPFFQNLPFNVAEENLQARIRGNIVMGLSNKFGYILLNTSNKSELAVGYGTLYGDMCGGLAVLGDVYKTQIFRLAKYINKDKAIIPLNTITKPPSAELRPGQKDSDSLPEYDVLDAILYRYIELRQGPKELIAEGFDEALVNRALKLVNTNEFKRAQTPPILRVSPKAFGQGRRMPIVAKYLS